MLEKDIKKFLIVIVLILLTYVGYLIIKPFLTAILGSFVLAYLFYPLHKKIKEKTKNEVFSAIITTVLAVLIILLPLVYISNAIITESVNLYKLGITGKVTEKISGYLSSSPELTHIFKEIITNGISYIKQQATKFVTELVSQLFTFIITIYATFIFLITGEEFIKHVKNIIPIKKKDELIAHLGDVTYSILFGLFVTALLEFVIALIVLKIVGIHAALILALLIGFLAFIPFLGPSLIWVPYAIIEAIKTNYLVAIILVVLGIILFIIETIIRPKIIGDRIKTNPLIILIGTLGGIQMLGIIGIILGPVILSALVIIIKEYYPEIQDET